MKHVRIILFSAFLPVFLLSCMREDVVYTRESQTHSEVFPADLPLPDFIHADTYRYSLSNFEDDEGGYAVHHFDRIDENAAGVDDSIVMEAFPELLELKPPRSYFIEEFGLPDRVDIFETAMRNSTMHTTYRYDNIDLYFGYSENLVEIRMEQPVTYVIDGRIRIGSTVEDVLQVLPVDNIDDSGVIEWSASRVLFRNIDGNEGYDYVDYKDRNFRLWFWGDRLTSIYLY